ncbi:unnamed protein product [Victoria cruziana]
MTRPSSSSGSREELAILARSCPSHLFSLFTFFLLSLISSLFMFLLVACPSSSSLTVENIRRHGLQGIELKTCVSARPADQSLCPI